MKLKKTLLSILLITIILPINVLAQESLSNPISNQISPTITSEDYIEFGKKGLFDATDSILLDNNLIPTYEWNFSDTNYTSFGQEVVHNFINTGKHNVTLTIRQDNDEQSVTKEIFVYDTQILMITDLDTTENFELIEDQAANQGVLLKVISSVEQETGFLTEEKLLPLITEESEFIKTADAIIFYTETSVGMQAFSRYAQNLDEEKKINTADKLFIKITNQNIGITAKLAQQSYEVFNPNFILLTRPEALNPIFETEDQNQLTTTLSNRAIEYRIIDSRSEKTNIFFLSKAVTNFIAKGIPTNTVYMLLVFPFIAFVIIFIRQVIGISIYGVFTPLVIALALYILGIGMGLSILLVIVAISYILRKILNKFKLLYIPKTGLVLSFIGLSFLGLIWFLSYYRVSLAISIAIFPMLVMSTLSEKFLSAQSEAGLKEALWGALSSVIVSVVAYYLIVWNGFNNLIMSWPELIILPIIGIIILGRFTGLRLTEYIRFRSLFQDKNIEE
ncbi:MAG: 7TM domain-containing protein [bacterium]|nr:7TM domain-containing protein [bacterium]